MNRRHFLGAVGRHTMAAGLIGLSPKLVLADALAPAVKPDWLPAVADIDSDIAAEPLRLLHGRQPAGLAGTLYRNGPAKFHREGGDAGHWFDGDGLVRAFGIQNGKAMVQGRFVDTEKRRAETAAHAMVMPGFGTTQAPGTKVANGDSANAANTSIIPVGGKLWALWEAGSPIEIEPDTLATIGPKTFRPDLKAMPFLAHPHIEPGGRIWNLGLAGGLAIVWRIAPDGVLEQVDTLKLPRASYVHDFTATETHLVIVLQPWVQTSATSPLTDGFVWQPQEGTSVLVVDKSDLKNQRRFDLPAFFCFHFADAWTETDGTIRFDACVYPDASFAATGGHNLVSGIAVHEPKAELALIALHANGRGTIERTGISAEFPKIDPRYAGAKRRYTVHLDHGNEDAPLFRAISVHDWRTGKRQIFDFGPGQVVEEMVFSPRPGSSDELDGWLIGTSLNLTSQATELHVFDAHRIEAGPICSWRASRSLPVGFHGSFVPVTV